MNRIFLKTTLCLFAVLGIVSCNRLDIAVTWADSFIVSQVDDYFDLSSQQSKELKGDIKKVLQSIRKNEFPKWAETFRRFEKELAENTLNETTFNKYFHDVLNTSRSLQPAFTETAVTFISKARSEQLEHFERVIRKKNIENEQKIQNSEKRRKEARKKYLRGIEMWIDVLSQNQDQLLNHHLSEHPFPAEALNKNRHHVLEKFIAAKNNPDDLKTFVRNYYTDKFLYATPEYKQVLKTYQTALEKFSFQLINSLSEKQKKQFQKNLLEKATALERLATKE